MQRHKSALSQSSWRGSGKTPLLKLSPHEPAQLLLALQDKASHSKFLLQNRNPSNQLIYRWLAARITREWNSGVTDFVLSFILLGGLDWKPRYHLRRAGLDRSYTELIKRRLNKEKWLQKGNFPQGHCSLGVPHFCIIWSRKKRRETWWGVSTIAHHVGRFRENVAGC